MRAILNQVILKPCESDSVSVGGIIVPESFKKRSSKAVVVSVGRGTKKRPMFLSKGQVVHQVKDHGTEIIENGEKYYLMDMDAVIAYY